MRAVKGPTARGWLLLILGLFLALTMGAITWNMAPSLMQPGMDAGGGTFTGTAEQAQLVLLLFGVLIVMGLTFAINGGVIIATGRQSRMLTIGGFLIAALLVVLVFAVMAALKPA